MSDVLEFPSQSARAFAFLEREMRAKLSAIGADEALINFAIDSLTSVYAEVAEASDFSFRIDLPGSITAEEATRLQQQIGEGVEGLRAQQHSLVLKLAAQWVLAEMKVFQHERSE